MSDYARHEHHDFMAAAGQALADAPLQAALVRLTSTLMAANRRGYAALPDSEKLRDHAKRIKEHTPANLEKYLEQLEASVQRNGGQVHWASTAEEARQIVLQIAKQSNCKRAVKSKSMTSEEVHLNGALEAAGVEVTETDFGEFIIQVAGERPSHLVAPAVHHTRESIARVLSGYVGRQLPDDARSLALTGRAILRNGRSKVLATPFRESLQCIRCGACLNACPVYRRIGGHAYGGVYSGPIGSILTPLYDSVSDNPHLPHASSLCGACQAACPVKINIPHMLVGLRE